MRYTRGMTATAYAAHQPGDKVAALRCVDVEGSGWTYRPRTATVVGFTPWDPATRSGDFYTVRFVDGAEDTVGPREVKAAKPAAPKGERKAPRAKVAKPAAETLPRIVVMIARTDSGEYGNATCPHCGADGRYVWTFRCDDGTKRGAMAGCIKLFPRSALVDEHQRLLERAADRKAKGWQLASWDQAKLEAIEQVANGKVGEAEAVLVVKAENAKRDTWLAKRGRR